MTEKKIAAGTGDVTWHDYVEADGKRVAMRVFDEQTLNTTWNYFVHDHLGSIVATMDSLGNVVERMSFDAWGKRREPATAAFYAAGFTPSFTTPRGFTGHEHIDEVGLVNMNARVYDPELGRFLQADSIVPDQYASQTLNRYTYVYNNPLSYTDPSGHFPFVAAILITAAITVAAVITQNALLKSIAAIAWAVVFAKFGGPLLGLNNYQAAFAGGFIGGGIEGGDLKSAAIGGFTALAFAGIHGLKTAKSLKGTLIQAFAKSKPGSALLHGLVGGLSSIARGGKFAAGFMAAGFSNFAGGYIKETGNLIADTAVRAVIGGTASVIGGGKFLSGAVTAAFGYLYNEMAGVVRVCRGDSGCIKVFDEGQGLKKVTTGLKGLSDGFFEKWDKTDFSQYSVNVTGMEPGTGRMLASLAQQIGGGIIDKYGTNAELKALGKIDIVHIDVSVPFTNATAKEYGYDLHAFGDINVMINWAIHETLHHRADYWRDWTEFESETNARIEREIYTRQAQLARLGRVKRVERWH